MKFLLDYVFPVTAITPTAQASTAFLKQVALVVKPNGGGTNGSIALCTSMTQVAAKTDNEDAQALFDAGMSKVYLVQKNDLDLQTMLDSVSDFWTLLVSSDFDDSDIIEENASGTVTITNYANLTSGGADKITLAGLDITAQAGAVTLGENKFQAATSNDATATSLASAINNFESTKDLYEATVDGAVVTISVKRSGAAGNLTTLTYTDASSSVGLTLGGLSAGKLAGGAGIKASTFDGVISIFSDDTDVLEDFANTEKRVGFYSGTLSALNMCYAFGSMLSNLVNWRNQQYITVPEEDGVSDLGTAESLFDSKISFALNDSEYGKRLGLFAAGGKAIVAPYIIKNLQVDLQSKALQYITSNQPQYTITEASLLETRLQKDVIDLYITREWITAGVIEVKLEQENFVASGYINVSEPKALWRVFSELRQTL